MADISGLVKALKDKAVAQYDKGAPYRQALVSALRGDTQGINQALSKSDLTPMDFATTFAPMGIIGKYSGDLGKIAPKFSQDIPNDAWLKESIDYAKSKPRSEVGAPYMNDITGSFSNHVMINVDDLAKLRGLRNEQKNVRQADLDWLVNHMGETGKLPIPEDFGKEYAPFVVIGHDGVPYVSEGNHRIMAAKKLGWDKLPVEIRYFDGGQNTTKNNYPEFSPETILNYYK